MTALRTTQMQRNFFESVALKRTKRIDINGNSFRYSKITSRLYGGFKKEKGGSIVESDTREYYATNRFSYLEEKLTALLSNSH